MPRAAVAFAGGVAGLDSDNEESHRSDDAHSVSDVDVETDQVQAISPKKGGEPEKQVDQDNLAEVFLDALPSRSEIVGSYYFAEMLKNAPNPCLCVSGLGLVGLPLSDRDARSIASCASTALFGGGKRKAADKSTKKAWEIGANRIKFRNPEFLACLKSRVLEDIKHTLGVPASTIPLILQLDKLLLSETESDFPSEQETTKPEGTFATVFVILPSEYTGGEFHVTHQSKTNIVDFAATSLLSTSVISWYTDVERQVKPITSGYRLALSFNLIQPPSNTNPLPCPPDNSARQAVQRVLQKWKNGGFKEPPMDNLLACLLEHRYDIAELKASLSCLKGQDLHLVQIVSESVAEEKDFTLLFASLEEHQWGNADDDGSYPIDTEPEETETYICEIIDLNGHCLFDDSRSKVELRVNSSCLFPPNPFDCRRPDEDERNRRDWDEPAHYRKWYYRTVLIVLKKSEVDELRFKSGGLPFAIASLQNLTKDGGGGNTDQASLWVNRILKKRSEWKEEHKFATYSYALQSQSSGLWNSVVESLVSLEKLQDLSEPWKLFGFQEIRPGLEKAIARSKSLQERIQFIQRARAYASDRELEDVQTWINAETDRLLLCCPLPKENDIVDIVSLLEGDFASEVEMIFFPKVFKTAGTYTFIAALMNALDVLSAKLSKSVQHLPAASSKTSSTERGVPSLQLTTDAPTSQVEQNHALRPTHKEEAVRNILNQCLQRLQMLWDDLSDNHTWNRMDTYADRIIQITNQMLIRKKGETLHSFVDRILGKIPPNASTIPQFYDRLCPRLVAVLKTHGISPSSPPFATLFKDAIRVCLQDILGEKPTPIPVNMRRIGCLNSPCEECHTLNAFLSNTSKTSMTSYWLVKNRQHVEVVLHYAKDLCTFVHTPINPKKTATTITKTRGLLETPKVLAAVNDWARRQSSVKTFLINIGDVPLLQAIMGERWVDVLPALDGKRWFGAPSAVPSPAIPPALGHPVAQQPPTANQGTKRKTSCLQPESVMGPTTTGTQQGAAGQTATATPAPGYSAQDSASQPAVPRTKKSKTTHPEEARSTQPVTQLGPVIDLAL